jgi:serine/threonine protein phosphatase 1
MAFMFPLFGRRRVAASIPDGERVYAIGDIHGEAQLFASLLRDIHADSAARGAADTTLVILGDFIDRGDSAAEVLLTMSRVTNPKVVILKGNHEASLVQAYRGDADVLDFWMRFGGAATLIGMGAPPATVESDDPAELVAALRATIDADLIDWLDALPTSWTNGDYYFTHAGIRPGVDLDAQDEHDLLWIRQPFLKSRKHHGKVIVHGHTIEPGLPPLGLNRIGIDTGAHEHGRLTAVGLEGDRQWILQTQSSDPPGEP